jgi:sn-glycerol 3-phosphate transport system substrate-binding protein
VIRRRSLLAGTAALAAARAPAQAQSAKTTIVWWHAMTGALAAELDRLVAAFNASQSGIDVQAVFKGGYADVLTAVIAAFRAGQAPHLVQIFDVGTENMMAARKAVKFVSDLVKETGILIDPNAYIPSVRGYYALPDGRMGSAPFNSSTAVMWINKAAFSKAGLDPDRPPATWHDIVTAAQAIKAKNAAPIPVTCSWFTWVNSEQYAAIHNIPFATKGNGFDGLDAHLTINSKPFVSQIARLLGMAKDGTFKYAGRDNAPDPIFIAGQAAITFNSSAYRGDLVRSARFAFTEAFLPYDPHVIETPINSIIGGASLWPMTAPHRTEAEYKAVALFLQFLSRAENDAAWAKATGYVPVTFAGYKSMRSDGWFQNNPRTDIPIKQLTRGHVTQYSRGIRLGRLPEIRNIIEEEFEKALQGQQNAQQVMDNAVERGNRVLRQFQAAMRA